MQNRKVLSIVIIGRLYNHLRHVCSDLLNINRFAQLLRRLCVNGDMNKNERCFKFIIKGVI